MNAKFGLPQALRRGHLQLKLSHILACHLLPPLLLLLLLMFPPQCHGRQVWPAQALRHEYDYKSIWTLGSARQH
jgi:hypothetical protein